MELDDDNVEIFRREVKNFQDIDKHIKETKKMLKPLQDRLKTLTTERKTLEQDICGTMGANNITVAQLPNNTGKLEYISKKAMVPITQKTVKEKMAEFFDTGPGTNIGFNSYSSNQKGQSIFQWVYGKQNRVFITKEQLKLKET
jgi:hypothetical protein